MSGSIKMGIAHRGMNLKCCIERKKYGIIQQKDEHRNFEVWEIMSVNTSRWELRSHILRRENQFPDLPGSMVEDEDFWGKENKLAKDLEALAVR